MRLIDIKELLESTKIYRDGEFEDFAQCIVKLNKKIITFFDDDKFLNDIKNNKDISCVICKEDVVDKIPSNIGILISEEPRYTFFKLYNLVMKNNQIRNKTIIGQNVKIGNNVNISEENVIIGDNVVIGPNTVIERNTIIEKDCVIGPNCIISSEGFEVKRRKDGTLYPVPHYGSVLIKEGTTLKSMVSIHKSVFDWDTTVIGKNCVIDSFVHIAHGNKIGNSILLGANCIISGNCTIEDYACIDPGACIAKRLKVGKHAKVSIGSIVTKDVQDGAIVTGNFAVEHSKWIEFVKKVAE